MSETLHSFVIIVSVLVALLALSGGLIWVERRVLALVQERYGPNRVGPFGIMQVMADMIKIMAKDDWVPPQADAAVFILAPCVVVAATLASFAIVPLAPGIVVSDLNIGLLFFLAMSSLAVYGVALGGWASNNKYSFLGAMRAAGQMLSYEVFMGLSLMGVVALAGSFRMGDIVAAQKGLWFCVDQPVGLLVFVVAGLAEARRLPFDLPEAESELVAGFHTEYSGMKFAMFFLGEYVGITMISALTVALFFGGWRGPWLPPLLWFVLKTMSLVCLIIVARGALPRPRYDQLMTLGWKLMLPLALLNLLVTGGILVAATR